MRHIPYVPRPDYEQLETTGLLRYPYCVRPSIAVRLVVPPELQKYFAEARTRAVLPTITVN